MRVVVHIVSASAARLIEGHVTSLCGVVIAEADYTKLWVMSEVHATCRDCSKLWDGLVRLAQ